MRSRTLVAALLAGVALGALPALAQEPQKLTDREIIGHVYEPEKLEPTPERIASLKVPEGFRVEAFASGLKNPRIMAVGPDGTVYVTRRNIGDVVMLKDADGDGKAEESRVIAARPQMHGIAIHDGWMYLATVNDVYRAELRADGSVGELERIIDDLPEGGQHPNRTLGFGPDGMLYVTVGSTCNACADTSPENATILRASPDGKMRRIYASGLRNTIGFDWEPGTGQLWGLDHGIDWLGDDDQPEELNQLVEGKGYGWPYIYADGKENPQDEPPGQLTMAQWKSRSQEPALLYTAHSAPMQLVFYEGAQFPAEYTGDAFATMRGSWNRKPASGYEVVRIRFEAGKPIAFEPFVTGFLTPLPAGGDGYFGRPVGLAVAKDGALLFTDDTNGVIYRVSYPGGKRAGLLPGVQLAGMQLAQAEAPVPKPGSKAAAEVKAATGLAMTQLKARDGAELKVESRAFEMRGVIPARFSEYDQRYSPQLSWSKGPEGTRSYAVIMEDPDAKEPRPFAHWLVYRIPAEVMALREGLPNDPRLREPEGVLQGRNSFGSMGWNGMKPPASDPPHHYHFQVFALDSVPDLEFGAPREEVLKALEGHVLAAGELVGTFPKD